MNLGWFWDYFGHVIDMVLGMWWQCVSNLFAMLWGCLRDVSEIFWAWHMIWAWFLHDSLHHFWHDLGMITACFWDDYGMFLKWLWHVFEMIMACFWDDYGMFLGWFWHVFGMIMACFWAHYDMLLGWFWHVFGPLFFARIANICRCLASDRFAFIGWCPRGAAVTLRVCNTFCMPFSGIDFAMFLDRLFMQF